MFEATRPRLTGLAYRLLGSISDAQDAVQDTYVKWVTYRGPMPETPAAWLSRVCTNTCLDRLKAADRKRIDYVGPWIPDQIQTEFDTGPEDAAEIASSLTTAFLMVLDRLTPRERAAFLLHDIFDMSYDETADVLGLGVANCRQLAARARSHVTQDKARHVPATDNQTALLGAFQLAVETGETAQLGALLRADTDLRADSGGKVAAIRRVITGDARICAFVSTVLTPAWAGKDITPVPINGTLGLMVRDDGRVHAAVSFGWGQDRAVRQIYVQRHPDKLALLTATTGLADAGGALLMRSKLGLGTGSNGKENGPSHSG